MIFKLEIMLRSDNCYIYSDFFRCIFEWTINKCSAMESVDAFVVAKQQGMIQQQIPNAGDPTGSHGLYRKSKLFSQNGFGFLFAVTNQLQLQYRI